MKWSSNIDHEMLEFLCFKQSMKLSLEFFVLFLMEMFVVILLKRYMKDSWIFGITQRLVVRWQIQIRLSHRQTSSEMQNKMS